MTRAEFWSLAGVEALCGVVATAFAVFPPVHPSPSSVDGAVAAAFLVLAIATGLLGPLWGSWVADVSLAVAPLLLSVFVFARPREAGQMTGALLLVALAVFAAYSRSRWRAWLLIDWMLLLFTAAALASPLMASHLYLVLVWMVVLCTSVIVRVLVRRLEMAASRDPLTGLLNRRGLEDRATAVAAAARRKGAPVTVAALDLDDFKKFNDEFGHRAGDELLTRLGEAWHGVLREGDLLGRTGGDEFVAVLPDLAVDAAGTLLERMRAADSAPWSVGLAEWRPDEDLFDAANRADGSLYADKAAKGRRQQS